MRTRRRGRFGFFGIVTATVLGATLASAPVWAVGVGAPIEVAAASMGIAGDVPELKAGRAVARQLEPTNDSELCAAGSIVIDAPLEALVASFRDLSLLERGGLVSASGRVSDTPSVADLERLPLSAADLEALRSSKRGGSDIKLSVDEIDALRKAGSDRVALTFREGLVRRVAAWRQSGISGLSTYGDKRTTVEQAVVARALLDSLGRDRAGGTFEDVESFVYWSVERFGSLKPFIALTNMTLQRRNSGVVRIETVQLYASHYCEGLVASIDLHELPYDGGPRTLVRLSFRTQVDAFGGILGGMKRKIARSRMLEQLVSGLERLRDEGPRVTRLAKNA
jgi:hypothetical protein